MDSKKIVTFYLVRMVIQAGFIAFYLLVHSSIGQALPIVVQTMPIIPRVFVVAFLTLRVTA